MSILAFHRVDHRFDLSVTWVTPRRFERQIQAAHDCGLAFKTLADYIADPVDAVAITFDDGYESVWQHAYPVLRRYGAPATVFVVAAYVGQFDAWDVNFGGIRFRHMNWQQLAGLAAAGWQIGSHGFSHQNLTRLSEPDLDQEVRLAKVLIEERLQRPVRWISYPFGNVNPRVSAACQRVGYEGGVIMGRPIQGVQSAFQVERLGVYLYDFKVTFLHKVFAKHQKMYKLIQKFTDFCSDGTVLVKQKTDAHSK